MNLFLKIIYLVAFFIVGYSFGSIPNGIIIGKIYHKDPREYGSKNIGGTNVGRTISYKAGAFTIILDMLKIIVPIILARLILSFDYFKELYNISSNLVYYWYGSSNILYLLNYYLVIIGCFIGHAYSIYIHFKGGKVVSVFSGFMISTSYLTLPVFGLIFFLILKKWKHVSFASMLTSSLFSLFLWILYIVYLTNYQNIEVINYLLMFNLSNEFTILLPITSTLGTILLIYKHKENIKRLKNHEESEIKWLK